ncbi:PREDICTED: GTP-binding protein 2 [Trachymyrmex cornetzi]|uniref:GTP-binding protein 2 n=1 Tax=Trachymyrmex cornetzi TaxID=471704 RepID=A0A151ITS9_9HYME|nr:PREDICTED: GTP-binding protein 2 [Trachymyrmex cornetzi]XP_018374678.1 PREDICTED: GTP-binding protein 2 [Trachymyrmex cornetzi]XP_018374679.1 PREDICTED: GTP-binding protein 2 [Trachymyrmex cornetzi]XP_018374680.1 PREDICTED: GTP-binding protein 2 [Trachymyrmex cornetzi]KYN10859.1 GTP-binding protein 2 [Trachymyrmex cornetzi]
MESFLQLFDPQNDKDLRKRQWDSENEGNELSDCDTSSADEDQEDRLPPEPEQGNIEYKLKLINPSSQRFEHLVTQMKWRLKEGHGEAIYQIGVEDNGRLAGLTKDEMKASLKTLKDMASRLGATIRVLRERIATSSASKTLASQNNNINNNNNEEKKVTEVLVKKLRKDDREDQDSIIDLRLAVTGAQDAGKSTLLGVLTQGELDNGRGRARLNMLRHLHEIKTGRTSSISHEIIGFDSAGHVLNYAEMATAEEICEHASKVVTFIDLAGHRKYLRTTVLGLTGYSPHHVMLVVAPPLNEASQEHMALCLALKLPFFIVVNKIDLGFCDMSETLAQLENAMMTQGYPKQLVLFSNNDLPSWDYTSDVIPVFNVSCVTGEGLEELTIFIKNLSSYETNSIESDPESCLFQIDETFRVVGLTQPVLGGLLVKGAIAPGTRLLVGPLPDGEFSPVKVVSLHRNKAPCCLVRASQSASLTLAPPTNRSPPLPHLRPGMVLVSLRDRPHATLFFQATVLIVYHATAIFPGFQTTVHVGNVRQTCVIEGIMDANDRGLQTNDTASVLFRFVSHPEYLHVGMRLLFREGRTKGIGKITQIFPVIGSQNSIK